MRLGWLSQLVPRLKYTYADLRAIIRGCNHRISNREARLQIGRAYVKNALDRERTTHFGRTYLYSLHPRA
jgi:hypothetical protein